MFSVNSMGGAYRKKLYVFSRLLLLGWGKWLPSGQRDGCERGHRPELWIYKHHIQPSWSPFLTTVISWNGGIIRQKAWTPEAPHGEICIRLCVRKRTFIRLHWDFEFVITAKSTLCSHAWSPSSEETNLISQANLTARRQPKLLPNHILYQLLGPMCVDHISENRR